MCESGVIGTTRDVGSLLPASLQSLLAEGGLQNQGRSKASPQPVLLLDGMSSTSVYQCRLHQAGTVLLRVWFLQNFNPV